MTINGYIEHIVYRNESNGYTILEVADANSETRESSILVGSFSYVEEGMYITATGEMKVHPLYGEQLLIKEYDLKSPDDEKSIEKYLASGAIKGIGEALAARIVKKFKRDTLRILEEEPERLAEIKGISERMAMSIAEQVEEKKDLRDAMLFLARYGISMNLALKIWNNYGSQLYTIIVKNPYKLADDLSGVGFKIADEIAAKVGINADSEYRIQCGILYVLSEAQAQGHMHLPIDELYDLAAQLLGVDTSLIAEQLPELQMQKKVIVKRIPPATATVYLASAYYTELNVARMLHDINEAVPIKIITGGPGTGKTTNIKHIIEECEAAGLEVKLAAPTGRAAKRMTEATGHEASTLHRLLEVSGPGADTLSAATTNLNSVAVSGDEYISRFQRDESNPLDGDVIIVDEMSMVDIYIFHALLRAIPVGTKLVLVGDTNQLPSVGPGDVLRDIIDSDKFDTLRLNKIYRQDDTSDIVKNAHRIINNEEIDLAKQSKDFIFIKSDNSEVITSAIIKLITEKLPKYVDADPYDIQVMTPMRKGPLGVESLNNILQEKLNPKSFAKTEKEIDGTTWREGDKVMQIKNNYDKGVYNGDLGRIVNIDTYAEQIEIAFDDDKRLSYSYGDAEELELAYAITIHKSQGSEYPAVIIPVYPGPRMLMTRNLIYTAITRAKKCACLVGLPQEFYSMTQNTKEMKRYSGLKERIEEIYI